MLAQMLQEARLRFRKWAHEKLCGQLVVVNRIYACSEFCAARIARDCKAANNLL